MSLTIWKIEAAACRSGSTTWPSGTRWLFGYVVKKNCCLYDNGLGDGGLFSTSFPDKADGVVEKFFLSDQMPVFAGCELSAAALLLKWWL